MLATQLIILGLILSPICSLQQTGASPIPNCKYHKCLIFMIPCRVVSVVELITQQKHHNSQWEKADIEVGNCSFSAKFTTDYVMISKILFLWNCHCGIVSTKQACGLVFWTKNFEHDQSKEYTGIVLISWSPTFIKFVMDLKKKNNKQTRNSENNVKIEIDC